MSFGTELTWGELLEAKPCKERRELLRKSLLSKAGKQRMTRTFSFLLIDIYDSNGFRDTLWAIYSMSKFAQLNSYLSARFAERALSVYENSYPDDPRPCKAVEALYSLSRGEISHEELQAAKGAALEAALEAAREAWDAVGGAAGDAAAYAAGAAAWDAAEEAAREEQIAILLQTLGRQSVEQKHEGDKG